MSDRIPNRAWPVGALLFCSGFCALVYQVGWLREFRLIFGASTAASAAVLAMFIGGLGLGGLVLGSRVDRHPRPLLFYSWLEVVVSLSAALTPFLLEFVQTIYFSTGGSTSLGSTIAAIVRLALSAVVLAVPTIAMGGTLPAAARSATRVADLSRRDVAVLYALNTLGAVAGCVVSTFVLLELFGTKQTLWLAAAVNILIALVARVVDRIFEQQTRNAPAQEEPSSEGTVQSRSYVAFLLAASATTGFAFFLMELVWYRLLAPLLGGSVFTFGLVLALALAGIGLGGLLYAMTAENRPATMSAFAASCLLEAVAVAGTYALGDRVAVLALVLLPLRAAGFAAQVGGWTIVASLVVLPPAIVAGYQFPLLLALFGKGRDRLGRHVGVAYAANTAGAVAGSLAGGFGILPWLSAPGAWRLTAVLLLVLGASAVVLSRMRGERRVLVPHVALAGVALACLASLGPTAVWRHGGVGAGRVSSDILTSQNSLRAWTHDVRRTIEWDRDGIESGIALAYDPRGYSFVVNGKADGSARGDAGTQVMLGLLGAIHHPHPQRALVIGLGTGSSAGWLAAVPSMERVDVVELESVVLDVARASRLVNRDVMQLPSVHVTVGDARETLLTSRERYDVIASEPSNPYRAGIASLFTREYYLAAYERLGDDGVFAQWVQAYEIDPRTLQTIYATLASVFPNVETWQTKATDLVLVASKRGGEGHGRAIASRLTQEPYKTAMANVWRATDARAFFAHRLADDSLARAIAGARGVQINTDDRNIVEFGLARSVGRSGDAIVPGIRALARQLGSDRAVGHADDVDPASIETAWVSFNASEGWISDSQVQSPPPEKARQAALRQYFERGDANGARALWAEQERPPRDLNELAMAADLEATAGSESAMPLIDQLRAYQPAEADTLLATLRWKQGRLEEAASALESALVRFRADPWPHQRYKEKALMLADTVARQNPTLTNRMFTALREPLALRALEDVRLQILASLSMTLASPDVCRRAVGALDANIPWNGSLLQLRRDCYKRANDARLIAAERDLRDYVAAETMPVGVVTGR